MVIGKILLGLFLLGSANLSCAEETKAEATATKTNEVKEKETPAASEQSPLSAPPVPPVTAAVSDKEIASGTEDLEGINTVDVSEPKGNWLYKRIWWERAERLYEKIKGLVNQIYEARQIFFTKRTELDRNILDPFYLSVGLSQGELNQILAYYNQQIDRDRAEHVTLDPKERQFLDMLVSEKKNLEALQNSVQMVVKIDHAIDTALMKLIEQINKARNYENQAWDAFKSINRELSDKKAREYFYMMDAYWKNVNNINAYIAQQFTGYFNDVVKKINQETESIKGQVKALKEKGINITDQGQQLAQQGSVKIVPERIEEIEVIEEEEPSFLMKIVNYIKWPFSYGYGLIESAVSWVKELFGFQSSSKPEETETIETVVEVKKVEEKKADSCVTPDESPVHVALSEGSGEPLHQI